MFELLNLRTDYILIEVMSNMVDVQTISIVVAAVGVFIAAINSIRSSRRAEEQRQLTLEAQQETLETRQAQLFMQVYNRWNQRDVVKAYGLSRYQHIYENFDDFLQKYHVTVDPEAYADLMTLSFFFEGLGILVKKGLIDISLVEDLFSQRIIWFWEEKAIPNVLRARQLANDPTQYDSIEYLYNVMKQRTQQTKVNA
jgi:hypothetical protein